MRAPGLATAFTPTGAVLVMAMRRTTVTITVLMMTCGLAVLLTVIITLATTPV